MINILPYIPFLNYKKKWINNNLEIIKSKRNNEFFKDNDGLISWDVVEYTLSLYYDRKYYDSLKSYRGLRLTPANLREYIEDK